MKAVLFDLDGTLLDTLGGITDASNVILARYGRPAKAREEMVHYIGSGARHQLKCAWHGEVDDATLDEVVALYCAYYDSHLDPVEAYAGVAELLRELKERGIKTAIVSNKPHAATEILAERFFAGLIDAVVGQKNGIPKKPAEEMVRLAMEELSVTREDCVFVGDGETDVWTAKTAGMPCVSVTWGYRSAEELLASGADILADTVEELRRFLMIPTAAARYITVLKRRRSIREFEARPVEKEKLEALLSAALLVPTSRDFKPVDYTAVTDRTTIDALSKCKAAGAGMLATAPLVIVLTSRSEAADTWCEDSSLAAITLQLLAEELGLASCWVQMHMRKDKDGGDAEQNVARVLGLPADRRCVCMLALGYRAEEKKVNITPNLNDPRIRIIG